jgi:hypothetical protein
MLPSIFSMIRARASTVMAPRRGSASLALGALWLLAVAACASAPEPRPASTEALERATSAVEPSTTVALDLRSRPASALRLEVVNANDATRGEQLGAQLESFRGCVESYREPRGYAGGRFGISGYIEPEGSLTQEAVIAMEHSEGFERCVGEVLSTLSWPATGLDVPVGFTASIMIHDASRRSPEEVRTSVAGAAPWYPGGETPRVPRIAWSGLQADAPGAAALSEDLFRRSPLLSDCLWHAWPTADISAEATILLQVAEGGTIVGRVRGESEPPEPALVECLGRLLSVMTAPPGSVGASLSVHLRIGTGGGSLR